MTGRPLSAILAVLVLLSGFPAPASEQRFPVPVGDSLALGPKDAPVTLVEFVDYQ